ncbi:hypothetical protein BJ138DRAFT_503787 [Hygrophoropsis aurantiaca]|uniref:Uncharacterized protein n=1 Tax=Hygrophoropsis aurantiaca TaxID=72124 RepID=A0ACB8AM58_9AGAM|nr:hypothetical protein BJ138DRAFT_503787 [Hygrophoropsis aurantiaca]
MITLAVIIMTIAQLGLGMFSVVLIIQGNMFDLGSVPYGTIVLAISVACDALISGSIYYYLRPGRAGIKRTETRIQNITTIFVNMGFLTCITSLAMIVLFFAKAGNYIAAPAPIACKSYVNSVLAILNARKPVAPPKKATTFELPTIQITKADNIRQNDSDLSGTQDSSHHQMENSGC